jgi:hypothetical protein
MTVAGAAVENGLMSMTASLETAVEYSGVKDVRGTVFEVQVGTIDLGASIELFSQYPKEKEFLSPPFSGMEVPPRCLTRLSRRGVSRIRGT